MNLSIYVNAVSTIIFYIVLVVLILRKTKGERRLYRKEIIKLQLKNEELIKIVFDANKIKKCPECYLQTFAKWDKLFDAINKPN